MDYAKYSKQAFDSLATDSLKLNLLVNNLQEDINLALHEAIHAKMCELVSSLNDVGHSLAESPQSKVGELDFAQIDKDEKHVFYLCCDTVISSGYRKSTDHTE